MERILVIAHRPMLRDVLHRAIGAWRHEPISTCDAMIGLELALTVHPDAVVVAHDEPLLDGAGVVRELREVLRDECPPILLVAGTGRESAATIPLASVACGATVVVRKPFRAADLRQALGRALPPRRAVPARPAIAAPAGERASRIHANAPAWAPVGRVA